jgi:predicted metal-dependent peptidase
MTSVMPKRPPFQGDTTTLMRRLSKAKTSLILESPFIGTIALNMPFLLSDDVPTAATNGKRVVFNPGFITDMTDEELKFLVAHEVFHPMMEHNFRRGERNPRKWNRACDYVINQLLTQEGIGKMPSGGLLNAQIYQAGGGTSDGIYNILEDESGDDGGYADGNGPFDDCEDAEGSSAEQAQAQAEMKIQVAQAAQAAKMMGKLSADMQRLVDEVLQPKVNWRDVLHQFITKARTDQRTYARPNRIFAAQGLYLPSISGEVMGELLFAVDCSGSIDQHTLNQFASEIATVKDDCLPVRIHVVYFDSTVSHYESYAPEDSLDIKPHGGGGTAFSPVFAYAQEHGIEPVACVFLTDLYCHDFGDAPDYPVLWVSNGADKAPFGEVVCMV